MNRFAALTCVSLLALAVPALAVEPHLASGPSSLLSAEPVFAPQPGPQRIGTLVPTGAGWTAFWADDTSPGVWIAARRVLATRVTPAGEVRDRTGIRITSEGGYSRFTAIPDPEGARAFWATPGTIGFALHTAVVSDEGDVSPTAFIGEYPNDATSTFLAVAASGTRFAAMLDRYVMIVEGTRLVRTVDLGGYGDPQSIVAAGSHFVVTWVAAGNILMRQTLDLDGNATGPAGGTGVANPARLHSLSSDGLRALLTWSDTAGLHFGIVDPATGQLAETSLTTAAWIWPHAVWIGSSYLVVWYDNEASAVLGVRVAAGGELLDVVPRRLYEDDPNYFEIAARGNEVAMLHQTGGCIRLFCEIDVVLAMLGPEASGVQLISAAAKTQSEPSVASDGEGFLALWREEMQLFVTETSASSRAPSSPSLIFDSPGFSGTVASGGKAYMAAWMAYRGGTYRIEGAALTRVEGTLVPTPFALATTGDVFPSSVSIGGAPGLFLVAWPRGNAKEAIRVGASGVILDTVSMTLPGDAYVYMPLSIAFDGDEFVVAWFSTETSADPHVTRVESARVTRGGTPRFDRTWATVPAGTIQGAAVGCSPAGSCLMVWIEQAAPAAMRWSVKGQRFRTGGELVDAAPFDIDVADRTQTRPNVSWDGSRFVVGWGKYIGDVTPERIEARVIPASGAVLLVPPDLLTERDIALQAPVTACNQQGRCILAGPEFIDDRALGRTWRIVKRFFGEVRHRAIRR